jgi:hypothetical protein
MADTATAPAAPSVANQEGAADGQPMRGAHGPNGVSESSNWQGLFQDESLKTSKSLARYKSLDDFGKAYTELETAFRTKSYDAVPGEDATAEAKAAFFKRLPGYPESALKYQKQALDVPAEAGSFDQAQVSSFLAGAHAKGLTNEQVGYVLGFYESFIGNQVQAHRDAAAGQINDAYTSLKERWGAQTDMNLLVADEYLRRTYGEDASWFSTVMQRQDGKAVPLRNVPEFIDMAFQLGRVHGHDKFVVGDGQGGAKSAEQSLAAIAEARAKYSKGELTSEAFNEIMQREGPNAYSQAPPRVGPPAVGTP